MASVNGSTSRKPSGSSSTHSGRSPSASPNPAGHHTLGTASNAMFGVGMGSGVNLKVANSSWQHARPRQVAPAQVALSAPQRFDGTSSPTRPGGLKGFGPASSPYSIQQSSLPPPSNGNITYDSIATSLGGNVDAELSLGLKGLSVQDDYDNSGAYRTQNQNIPVAASRPHAPSQGPYTSYYPTLASDTYSDYPYSYDSYRSTDLSLYGSASLPTSTSRTMYTPVPPTMTPLAHPPDLHRGQSGVYYPDYPNRGPGQFYFHPSQMGYPVPPHLTPQLSSAQAVGSMIDKKRELQGLPYGAQQQHQQQQLALHQNLYLPQFRGGAHSPHPQNTYSGGVEYATGIPSPFGQTTMYTHGPTGGRLPALHPHHAFQQGPSVRGRRGPESSPDSGVGLRSALLEEFRANKSKKWELRDIFGHIVEFSGDQHGSRFIQQKLETASSDEKQLVFDEILPDHAMPLITDVFGNYVVQKLFEHGTQLQKEILANAMTGHIVMLSLQMYGCRVVQKAIEYILPEQQAIFVKELDGSVMKCVKDANGNHVIQKLIERVSPERLTFINALKGNVYDLATHPYGCRVLQRCFEHLAKEQTRPLLDELHRCTINLMQDQFGNYVIQFVLENGTPEDRNLIISKLQGQMLNMARHKFASNVCEKALVTANLESRRALIDEIITPKQDGNSPILIMMKDQFANYVLQRALTVVEGEQQDILISKIRPHLISMRRYSSAYSKHLMSIERLMIEKTAKSASSTAPHSRTIIPNDTATLPENREP